MGRYLKSFSLLAPGGIVGRDIADISGFQRISAFAICSASAWIVSALLCGVASEAAEKADGAQLIETRQCDRCGFGTVRLEMAERRQAVSVGYLTDDDLARISALLQAARRGAAKVRNSSTAGSGPEARFAESRQTRQGEEWEPALANDSAAGIFEALTKGGGLGGPDVASPSQQSRIGGLNYDDGAWFSLTLRTPQLTFRTTYSP